MHRIGRLHFKGQVGSLGVVDLYCLSHHLAGLSKVPRAVEQKLAFQDPVDSFCQSILIGKRQVTT